VLRDHRSRVRFFESVADTDNNRRTDSMSTNPLGALGHTLLCERVPRATVYHLSSLGWVRTEESTVTVSLVHHSAQFPSAIRVQGKPKGRSTRAYASLDFPILVLKGWGHPEPARVEEPEAYAAENDAGFTAEIDAYIARKGKDIVLADLRKHDQKKAPAAPPPAPVDASVVPVEPEGPGTVKSEVYAFLRTLAPDDPAPLDLIAIEANHNQPEGSLFTVADVVRALESLKADGKAIDYYGNNMWSVVVVQETPEAEAARCEARALELDGEGSEFEAEAYRKQAARARERAGAV
jgi:hypothetical protein